MRLVIVGCLAADVLVFAANAADKPELPRAEAIQAVSEGELRVEPMFASAGIVYGSPQREGLRFEYRKKSSDPDGAWQATYAPRWFDEVNNYRGMAWKLDENTEYELRVVVGERVGGESRWREVSHASFKTWASEVPIAKVVYLDENTKFPLTISDQGTESGWVRYTTKPGVTLKFAPPKTVDAMITVDGAKYLVLDDLKIIGGDVRNVIDLKNSHYVRVRNCEVSGFGHLGECRMDFAGVYYAGYDAASGKPVNANRCNGIRVGLGMRYTVVERCYLHDPVARSTTWRHSHPAGANGINMGCPDHSTSLRYNNIIGADEHRWDDAITGRGNFWPNGGFHRNAEVYGNFAIFANDDCIELDGGQQNVACWGNRFEGSAVGVSIQGNVVSPSFVVDNLFAGQCEERGYPGATVKTSGFDLYGQGPFSAILDNVFYGRGKGIKAAATLGKDPNRGTSNAGRVGRMDIIGNTFCGKQKLNLPEQNPKGVMKDNRFGVELAEKDLDRAYPYRPIPFLLDTCIIDVGREHTEKKVKIERLETRRGAEPQRDDLKFEVVKCAAFDWFEVEPKSGVLTNGMELTVGFRPGLKDAPVYRGAFLVRTEDGFARPVSVYARTDWTQPEKCDKPGTIAVYAHPEDGVKDEEGFTVYTFEAPKDARYFFHVYAQADQWPTAMAAVDGDTPKVFTVQTCWQYPVWCVIWPGQPMYSIKPGRLKHYDLKAGKHTLRIKAKSGDFKPLAFVMTDKPLDFEPLIDSVTR